MINPNDLPDFLQNLNPAAYVLLGLFLLCLLAFVANLFWALQKWLDWKWCERSADYSLFYRVCRVRYGIMDSGDLTSEENQQHIQEVERGYKRFSHCSIEQLGRVLDRQRLKYDALQRKKDE